MSDVTFSDIDQEVHKFAAERPDYVYRNKGYKLFENDTSNPGNDCYYQHGDGVPGCIFGHAFLSLGFKLYQEHEGVGADILLSEFFGIDLTRKQCEWVKEVQSRQDGGASWADAVKLADDAFA